MKPSILGLLLLLTWQLPATLIPGQNLARRIESSDSIVVAKMIRGTVRASGSQVSNDVVLRIERVLKGSLVAGTTVPARLEGRGMFIEPKPTETPASPLYGIWFLDCAAQPCTVVSRDRQLGTLDFAIVMLPEPAPAAQPGTTPAASVAAELATSLRWIAETHPSELTPRGTVSGPALSEFRSIVEGLLTLEPATMLAVMKPLTTEKSPALRVVGIQALIAANDPDGV